MFLESADWWAAYGIVVGGLLASFGSNGTTIFCMVPVYLLVAAVLNWMGVS